MQAAIDSYFLGLGVSEIDIENGKTKIEMNPPSITGLALHLGFESRQSMYAYEKNGEFSYTIKKARTRCEQFIEENTMKGYIPAAVGIFYLKNHGWTDRSEHTLITDEYSKKTIVETLSAKHVQKITGEIEEERNNHT